ncbi:caspase family protein [Azospirillum sp.]|uniref:caspase family protein n=1 Tax=Azospirillum sp. TaxID=34012 RepID=UPI00260AD8FD|nr:caspase family protein [Azospirillum sp.]
MSGPKRFRGWVVRPVGLPLLIPLILFIVTAGSSRAATTSVALPSPMFDPPLARPEGCPVGAAIASGGQRRLALIVGVGRFRDSVVDVRALKGPDHDAGQINTLLTSPRGYGFPKENVCVLTGEDATLANVRTAFQRLLTGRAQPGDMAVFYFAGHGVQIPDQPGGDETDDGLDEALVMHDADLSGNGYLLDDELDLLLTGLRARTGRITLIIDACTSGSAERGPGSTGLRTLDLNVRGPAVNSPPGGGSPGWVGGRGGEEIVLSAAADGTLAFEQNGAGVFTTGFVKAASRIGQVPPTYRQIMRAVRQATAPYGQIPSIKGDDTRLVFDNTERVQPLSWEVAEGASPIRLRGTPMPGWGEGTRLRVYDSNAVPADFTDPVKAKASLVLERMETAYEAVAVPVDQPRLPPLPGDLAILVAAAPQNMRVPVRIRLTGASQDASIPGGVPPDRADRLKAALLDKAQTAGGFELVEKEAAFEFATAHDGALVLFDPEGRVRATFVNPKIEAGKAATLMWHLGLQWRILSLSGEGGGDFVNNETLTAKFVPYPAADSRCAPGPIPSHVDGEPQLLPEGRCWQVQVTAASDMPYRLRIGGLLLSHRGGIHALESASVPLGPGETHSFTRVFKSQEPFDAVDHILFFGTQESVGTIPWHQLEYDPDNDGAPTLRGAAYDDLLDWIGFKTRSARIRVTDKTWTTTHLSLIVKPSSDSALEQNPSR